MDDAYKLARRHCMFTLFSALIVVVCVCIGVTMNLTTVYDENFDHMGIRTFCMFTVNSNILCAMSMSLVIPYAIDGFRKHNFHVPRWVMVLVLTGVTSTTLTFLVSLFILAPVKGFVLIFTGSRFFLHGVCPVLAIIAFCFFMTEKDISLSQSLIALIPVFIYAVLYYTMVVLIGEENGGWNDFYGFATRIPVWIPMAAIMPLTFLIATVLRVLHNKARERRHRIEAEYYSKVFKDVDLRKIVGAVARNNRRRAVGKDILIPGRVIAVMMEHSQSDASWDELCRIYLEEYLTNMEVLDLKKIWI